MIYSHRLDGGLGNAGERSFTALRTSSERHQAAIQQGRAKHVLPFQFIQSAQQAPLTLSGWQERDSSFGLVTWRYRLESPGYDQHYLFRTLTEVMSKIENEIDLSHRPSES